MGEPLDRRERRELCDLFLELGPDVPTMCEGWDAFDLAVHLVVRERSMRSAPGILLGDKISFFAHQAEAASAKEHDRGFEQVVERVRGGPPLPIRPISPFINLNEYAVHHEDLRRANGLGPRPDREDLQDALWKQYRVSSRLVPGRPKGFGLILERSNGDTIEVGKAPAARITGEPLEIGLYLFGRRSVARVHVGGDPEAQAAYEQAKLGL